MHMQLCLNQLDQAGHSVIMTYMDPLLWDQRWHVSAAVKSLQANLRPHMSTFDSVNMVEYARGMGHEISSSDHPLEAYKKDPQYLKDFIRSYCKACGMQIPDADLQALLFNYTMFKKAIGGVKVNRKPKVTLDLSWMHRSVPVS